MNLLVPNEIRLASVKGNILYENTLKCLQLFPVVFLFTKKDMTKVVIINYV